MVLTDSLHREEFGATGKISTCAVKAGKGKARELTSKGIAEETALDCATVTVMGMAVELGMPPNCKAQERACKALPVDSCVETHCVVPRTLMLARNSPKGLFAV